MSDAGDKFQRLKVRMVQVAEMFPNQILLITQSEENKVLVYDPRIDAAQNRLLEIVVYEVDLDRLPLQPKALVGKGHRLFRMDIECPDPTKKMPRYYITVPVMPERRIEAVVSKGEVIAKSHINKSNCRIQRVHVSLSRLLGTSIPDIHRITLYGFNNRNEPVEEPIDKPTLGDFMSIMKG